MIRSIEVLIQFKAIIHYLIETACEEVKKVKVYEPPISANIWQESEPDEITNDIPTMNNETSLDEQNPTSNSKSDDKYTMPEIIKISCDEQDSGKQDTVKGNDASVLKDYYSFLSSYIKVDVSTSPLTTLVSQSLNLMNASKAFGVVQQHLSSNVYLSSLIGCVSESLLFVSDRASTMSETYLSHLVSDDPERIHLQRVRDSSQWDHLLLRYSMASLSHRQRQLVEETRDGGQVLYIYIICIIYICISIYINIYDHLYSTGQVFIAIWTTRCCSNTSCRR